MKGTLKVEFDFKGTKSRNMCETKGSGGNHRGGKSCILREAETSKQRERKNKAEHGVLRGRRGRREKARGRN